MKDSIGSCIIVGGGPAGIQVARELAKEKGGPVDVTIVDRQDYMDWSLASPRMLVDPDNIEKIGFVMPLKQVCEFVGKRKDGSNHTKFVQGAVAEVSPKSVTLEDGTKLEADTIVLAIGGQYAGSGSIWKPQADQTTKELRVAAFKDLRAKADAAKSILVVGAGPAGVEVAGELKSTFPQTTVTCIGRLLPNSPEKLQVRMKTALEGLGVVLKEGHVDVDAPNAEGNVVTREGETISGVDLILNAAGFKFSGGKIVDATLSSDVSERGQFKCRPTLQLESCNTVFACGDIVAVPEGCYADVKGITHAETTAKTVAENVLSYLKKKALEDFPWSKTPINVPMITALGPNTGVAMMGMPFACMEDFLARKLKCKAYFMNMKGSEYGKGKTW